MDNLKNGLRYSLSAALAWATIWGIIFWFVPASIKYFIYEWAQLIYQISFALVFILSLILLGPAWKHLMHGFVAAASGNGALKPDGSHNVATENTKKLVGPALINVLFIILSFFIVTWIGLKVMIIDFENDNLKKHIVYLTEKINIIEQKLDK